MKIKTVLFDLDGTLLPMDQEEFTKTYFKLLCQKMSDFGYEPKKLSESIWKSTYAMVKNNGQKSNETVFWNCFASIYGNKVFNDKKYFDEFYENEFQKARESCGFNPHVSTMVKKLKSEGFRIVLATNPLFPATATESRIRWTGLEPSDFELYTTYENICSCKPNPEYYREIIEKLDLNPKECIMVGNDVTEDMVAGEIGMDVFLITDCLINKNGEDINKYPHGTFEQMMSYILSRNNTD